MLDPPAVDLSSCDREPIHVPGAIQPHGVLLALSQPDFVVRSVSANCRTLVGREPEEVLGHRIDEVIRGDLVREDLVRASPSEEASERYPVLTTLLVDGDAIPVDAEFHRSGELLLVEIEPAPGPIFLHRSYRITRAAVGRINRAEGLKELYRVAVEEMRRLTGFDRVMVYRFDADWNGDVVAEDRAERLNSFLGLRYPASDIPAQARELYRTHWLRLIADVDYEPVPLVPPLNPLDGRPIDLSDSTLRSVSPIHLEYLRNMGVTASMSVSLLDRGRLWGLIACHHYSGPLRPPLEVRAAAELLGQTLSLRLTQTAAQEEERRTFRAHTILASLMSAVLDESRPALTSLTQRPRDLLDLTRATGCALHVDGQETTVGLCPPTSTTRALVDLAAEGGHEVLALDRVPDVLPDLAMHRAVACGALVMRPSEQQYVVWFRPELVQTVSWGGDPANAAISRNEGDEVRISPRKSFEVWQEKVRGRSEPWEPVDRSLAAELRHDLIDALYARSRRLASTATTLQRSLLPEQLPPVPGWRLAVDYRPSVGGDVGGDWYDVLVLGSGLVLCALGDVAGHGVAAAGSMGQLRNALRAYAVEQGSPGSVLERLGRLADELLPEVLATCTVVLLDPATGQASIASAGHPPACLVTGAGEPRLLPIRPAAPLGVLPDESVEETTVQVEPGGTLVLYSDGLVERRDEPVDRGLERLVGLSGGQLGATELCTRLIEECRDPQGDDDATVLALRRDR